MPSRTQLSPEVKTELYTKGEKITDNNKAHFKIRTMLYKPGN